MVDTIEIMFAVSQRISDAIRDEEFDLTAEEVFEQTVEEVTGYDRVIFEGLFPEEYRKVLDLIESKLPKRP